MSQVETLKAHFDAGHSLTVLEALQMFGIYALSQRVGNLRREGYPVVSTMIQLSNGKRIAKYRKGPYGDGVHDDTFALQAMINDGAGPSGP